MGPTGFFFLATSSALILVVILIGLVVYTRIKKDESSELVRMIKELADTRRQQWKPSDYETKHEATLLALGRVDAFNVRQYAIYRKPEKTIEDVKREKAEEAISEGWKGIENFDINNFKKEEACHPTDVQNWIKENIEGRTKQQEYVTAYKNLRRKLLEK